MKTAVTVINTRQVSMDEFRDFKTTKVFDDNSTIGEIKDWIIKATDGCTKKREHIGLSGVDISNVVHGSGEIKKVKSMIEQQAVSIQADDLVDFLIYLNNKKLINNHDFDYEKEAKNYIKKMVMSQQLVVR